MSKDEIFIHPTSTVHHNARLDSGIYIGPYCFIGENVSIGKNTRVDANIFISGRTEIGESCHFSSFSSIGTEPQDINYKDEETLVKIGNRNIFREFITVHRGTVKGGGKTVIGDGNYFMAYSHIAHDCNVGNEVIFINAGTLGGHVTIEDYATVGAFSAVHQFCRVGKHAFIGGFSVITQDVCPFCKVAGGRPPLFIGLNAVGLRRRGFSRERIKNIKLIFKIIFYSQLNTEDALTRIDKEIFPGEDRDEIVNFIRSSKRGIVKKTAEQWNANLE